MNDSGFRLASGFVASADIYTSGRKNFTMVPVASIVEADGLAGNIYILADDNRVRKVRVGIAALSGTMAAVYGIPLGVNMIVSEGMSYLRDGELVEIIK